ncbi:MAG: hypothetical protein OEM39_04995 [Acidimicrobiia bacterium]|nr:hypothetical protein [Acidimicrobiia bacterium]MDH3463453.1 hypothetical protein [Acidimicrobiia bacterium]
MNRRWLAVLVGLLMVAVTACTDSGALDDALAEVDDLNSTVEDLEEATGVLEAETATLEADIAALEADKAALEADKSALEETISSTGQALILQADIVGDGCMLQNAYINDGEAKATFRVRVYDPITGEQLDDQALASVTVTLDGNDFELAWGPHPPDTDLDFFWTYGWEIFEDYPAGNVPYTITATAVDGRTGQFDPFNVPPSLLTVMDA